MSYTVEKDWTTESGLRAVVIMVEHLQHRCGYVGIDKDHPLYGAAYNATHPSLPKPSDDTPIGKRSLLTLFSPVIKDEHYTSPEIAFDVHGSLTYSGNGKKDYPVKSDLWWFGYDCGHAGDAPATGSFYDGDVHRTLDYCINECESLSKQIAEVK